MDLTKKHGLIHKTKQGKFKTSQDQQAVLFVCIADVMREPKDAPNIQPSIKKTILIRSTFHF